MDLRRLCVIVTVSLLVACGGSSDPAPALRSIAVGDWDPVGLGWYVEYEMTRAAGPSVASRGQIVAFSPTGFTRRTTAVGTPGDYETTFTIEDGTVHGTRRAVHAADGSVTSTMDWAPGYVLLSANATPGSSETTVSTITEVPSLSEPVTYESTRVVTVDGLETVTVPAGTFTALKTTAHITDTLGGDVYNVGWWVSGVGRVKIVNYEAGSPADATTYVLTGYGTAPLP